MPVLPHRRNLMNRHRREQFQYILRDETTHLNFGIDLINGIKSEKPHTCGHTSSGKGYYRVKQAVELELQYAPDCLPNGIWDSTPTYSADYVQYIADRR